MALGALYAYAFLLGLLLGAVYDVLRITRVLLGVHYSHRMARRLRNLRLPLLSPTPERKESRVLGVVVFVEDLLFCLLAGILLILLFYEKNDGVFRFPVFLCAAGGFCAYRVTLGRLVMLFSEVIAFGIESAARYLFFFLSYPLIQCKVFLIRRIRWIYAWWNEKRNRRMRIRYTKAEYNRLQSFAACVVEPQASNKKNSKEKSICKRIPKNSSA